MRKNAAKISCFIFRAKMSLALVLIKLANDLRTTNVKPKGMLDIFYLFNFKSTTDFMLSFYEYLSGFVPQH
jgi:hypothetical protein